MRAISTTHPGTILLTKIGAGGPYIGGPGEVLDVCIIPRARRSYGSNKAAIAASGKSADIWEEEIDPPHVKTDFSFFLHRAKLIS